MTTVDVLGFWFPLSGVVMLGVLWLLLRDTLRTPPAGGADGAGGGSDRLPRPPWSWSRRTGPGDARSGGPRRARVRR
jgi:hypothetical protein